MGHCEGPVRERVCSRWVRACGGDRLGDGVEEQGGGADRRTDDWAGRPWADEWQPITFLKQAHDKAEGRS